MKVIFSLLGLIQQYRKTDEKMVFTKLQEDQLRWVKTLNLLAQQSGIHSILVMQSHPETMEVIFANDQPVYKAGDLGPKSVQAGCHKLYCEQVVNTQQELLVMDASIDPQWQGNEDWVKFGLGTYLGFPLFYGDQVVGTVCALHDKPYDFYQGDPAAYEQLTKLKQQLEQAMLGD